MYECTYIRRVKYIKYLNTLCCFVGFLIRFFTKMTSVQTSSDGHYDHSVGWFVLSPSACSSSKRIFRFYFPVDNKFYVVVVVKICLVLKYFLESLFFFALQTLISFRMEDDDFYAYGYSARYRDIYIYL